MITTYKKTVLEYLMDMPKAIDYRGWRFIPLVLSPDNEQYAGRVGYYLSELLDKKTKYKKEAFKMSPRRWTEKKDNYRLDSVGTNILIQEPILWNDDEGLIEAIEEIFVKLEAWRVYTREVPIPVTDSSEVDDTPNSAEPKAIPQWVIKGVPFLDDEPDDDFQKYAQLE